MVVGAEQGVVDGGLMAPADCFFPIGVEFFFTDALRCLGSKNGMNIEK